MSRGGLTTSKLFGLDDQGDSRRKCVWKRTISRTDTRTRSSPPLSISGVDIMRTRTTHMAQVTRWHHGDMKRRWCVAGLFENRGQFPEGDGAPGHVHASQGSGNLDPRQPSGTERDIASEWSGEPPPFSTAKGTSSKWLRVWKLRQSALDWSKLMQQLASGQIGFVKLVPFVLSGRRREWREG